MTGKRFNNPYEYAVIGVLTELAVFSAFLVLMWLLAIAAAWLG